MYLVCLHVLLVQVALSGCILLEEILTVQQLSIQSRFLKVTHNSENLSWDSELDVMLRICSTFLTPPLALAALKMKVLSVLALCAVLFFEIASAHQVLVITQARVHYITYSANICHVARGPG